MRSSVAKLKQTNIVVNDKKTKRGKMPKISIIIPVYNVEKYLERCLDSIVNQTFTDWEALLICNGKEKDFEICEKYCQKDKRFSLFHNISGGLGGARNFGLDKSKGEYILYVDADDCIHPQLLEITSDLIEKNEADYVHFGFCRAFFAWTEINKKTLVFQKTNDPLFLGCSNKRKYKINFNVWSALYRKSFIEDLRFIPDIISEDVPYTYAVLAKHPSSIILAENLYYYNVKNEHSLSHKKPAIADLESHYKGLEYIWNIYKDPELKKELNFLKKDFIPVILRAQYKLCKKADPEIQKEMWAYFSNTLKDLKEKGLFGWQGHKLKNYLRYRRLIKKGEL